MTLSITDIEKHAKVVGFHDKRASRVRVSAEVAFLQPLPINHCAATSGPRDTCTERGSVDRAAQVDHLSVFSAFEKTARKTRSFTNLYKPPQAERSKANIRSFLPSGRFYKCLVYLVWKFWKYSRKFDTGGIDW